MAPAPTSSARSLMKDIVRGSGLYSIALVAPTVAGVLLVPITTRALSQADYGVCDLLTQVTSVLSILLGMNFSAALGYHYFAAEPGEPRRRVAGTALVGSALIGAAAALVCLPFAGLIGRLVFPGVAVAGYLSAVFVLMAPSFVLEGLFAWSRVENRASVYVTGALLRVAMTVLGTITLVGFLRLRVWGVIGTSTASALVAGIFLLICWLRTTRFSFDARLFVRMAKFAAPLSLSWLAGFVVNFGDRFLLPHYTPFTDLGIYALSYKCAMLMSTVFGSFQSYWGAQIYGIKKREDGDVVFARVFTYVLAVISFVGIGVSVWSRPMLRLFVGKAFQGAAPLVPLLVLAYYLRAIGDFFRFLLMVAGKPGRFAACMWIGAATCIAGYLLLIPRYGMWGAATATLAACAADSATTIVWSYRLSRYRIETRRVVKIGMAATAAVVPYWLLRGDALVSDIGAATLSLVVFPTSLWFSGFLTPGEIRAGKSALWLLAEARLGRLWGQSAAKRKPTQ